MTPGPPPTPPTTSPLPQWSRPIEDRAEGVRPVLSVVVPMFDEAEIVDLLVARLVAVLRALGEPWEVLLVDDGSRDTTWQEIAAAHRGEPAIRGLSLLRNFGHQSALLAGLAHARGDAVITMDGDLQHPPEVIPELVAAWRGGYSVVSTLRLDSADTGWFKRKSSHAFYRLFSALSGLRLPPGTSDFRLLDRRVIAVVLEMGASDLFLRGMVEWVGAATASVPYQAGPRARGEPKYSLLKMIRLSVAAMVSFSSVPLKAGIWLGLATGAMALAEIAYIFVQYFRGETVPGWASLLTVVSFMFAVLFVLLGIMGTYVASIHDVLKHRPRFLLRGAVGFDDVLPGLEGDRRRSTVGFAAPPASDRP